MRNPRRAFAWIGPVTLAGLGAAGCSGPSSVPASGPGEPQQSAAELARDAGERVILVTDLGEVEFEVYPEKAPVAARNFLAYVDQGLYEGATFYRVVRAEHGGGDASAIQVVQGGLLAAEMKSGASEDPPPPLPPIAHETTDVVGLRNLRGVVSYARLEPGTAGSEFFINMIDNPALDTGDTRRQPDGMGYTPFGRVVRGMEVLEQIQGLPTDADSSLEMLRGQVLTTPVMIRRVERVNPGAETALDP